MKDKLRAKIQRALDEFPKIVKLNRTEEIRKQKFADKIFGELAKKVYQEVHGKKKR